ncbi:MAG: MBL fold metallo-hydrolase [Bacteroidales bacterium]|nr:MBL fold metallo-hydrolase [Bacteroidales bacterium]
MLQYKRFIFNPIQVNTWVVYNSSGDCVIFDPGCSDEREQKELSRYISEEGLKPLAAIATHGHFDHIPGVSFVTSRYDCPFLGNEKDQVLINHAPEQGSLFGFSFDAKPLVFDRLVEDGECLQIGGIQLDVMHVPGHSAGSLAFYSPDSRFVVVGDVLFKGSIGRTDLPGGDYETLIKSIKDKLMTLPDETVVMPGHGFETSIGLEKTTNPFLL